MINIGIDFLFDLSLMFKTELQLVFITYTHCLQAKLLRCCGLLDFLSIGGFVCIVNGSSDELGRRWFSIKLVITVHGCVGPDLYLSSH